MWPRSWTTIIWDIFSLKAPRSGWPIQKFGLGDGGDGNPDKIITRAEALVREHNADAARWELHLAHQKADTRAESGSDPVLSFLKNRAKELSAREVYKIDTLKNSQMMMGGRGLDSPSSMDTHDPQRRSVLLWCGGSHTSDAHLYNWLPPGRSFLSKNSEFITEERKLGEMALRIRNYPEWHAELHEKLMTDQAEALSFEQEMASLVAHAEGAAAVAGDAIRADEGKAAARWTTAVAAHRAVSAWKARAAHLRRPQEEAANVQPVEEEAANVQPVEEEAANVQPVEEEAANVQPVEEEAVKEEAHDRVGDPPLSPAPLQAVPYVRRGDRPFPAPIALGTARGE